MAAFLLWSRLRRAGADIWVAEDRLWVHPLELAREHEAELRRYRRELMHLAGPWSEALAFRLLRSAHRALGARLREGLLHWLFSERPEDLEAINKAGEACDEAYAERNWERFAEALQAYWEAFERAEAAYRAASA